MEFNFMVRMTKNSDWTCVRTGSKGLIYEWLETNQFHCYDSKFVKI